MSNKELHHFPFYRSYAEAVLELNDKERLSIYDGMIRYAFLSEEYKPMNSATKMAFTLIKPIMDTTIKKVLGGSKGGRKKEPK